MTIETVLLDAGGVILDETAQEAAMAREVAAFLSRHDPKYTVARYAADAAEAVRCYAPNVYQVPFWKVFAPDVDRCEAAWREFLPVWRERRPPHRLMDGIGPELRRLAGRFRLGLAGQYGAVVLDVLEEGGLIDLLSWRHTQDDFDVTKPDPRFYERIAAAFGVDPTTCVMVGDRIDKDVIPARALGMATVRIRHGLHRDQEPRQASEVPDVELPSVVGLAEAIERLASREPSIHRSSTGRERTVRDGVHGRAAR
jgi:putative hydrolase of the HAD superfamily